MRYLGKWLKVWMWSIKMAEQPTGNKGGHQDVPQTDIVIEKAEVIK